MSNTYVVTCSDPVNMVDFKCNHNHEDLLDALGCFRKTKNLKQFKCNKCGKEWVASGGRKCRAKKCDAMVSELKVEPIIKNKNRMTIKRVLDDGETIVPLKDDDYHDIACFIHGLKFKKKEVSKTS